MQQKMIKNIPAIKNALAKLFKNDSLGFSLKATFGIYLTVLATLFVLMVPVILFFIGATVQTYKTTGMTPGQLREKDAQMEAYMDHVFDDTPVQESTMMGSLMDKKDTELTPFSEEDFENYVETQLEDDMTAYVNHAGPVLKGLWIAWFVVFVLGVIYLGGYTGAGYLIIVQSVHSGKLTPIKEVLKLAQKKTLKMVWLSFLSGIIMAIGYLLLIVPGIIASIVLMFAPFYLIREDISAVEAMKKSFNTTKGFGFQLFTHLLGLLFLGLLLAIPAYILVYTSGMVVTMALYLAVYLIMLEYLASIESIKDMHRPEGERPDINKGLETTSTR